MGYPKICQMKRCPEKTVARISDQDNTVRRDLCKRHVIVALDIWDGTVTDRNPSGAKAVIVDTWNGVTKEDLQERLDKINELRGFI